MRVVAAMAGLFAMAAVGMPALGSSDRDTVAALDKAYQAAVKANDAAKMERILHPAFELALGDGRRISRKALIETARSGRVRYDRQEEESGSQTVKVSGDTAVVTAKLWIKGREENRSFDRKLWFTDTYVRTKQGWRHLFGQASLPLPPA
jgi:ketosteroid isomerase-like protein